MATTTKTLTPTNQTITLPDMTERPNASILVDGIGKNADAINALSDQITSLNTSINDRFSKLRVKRFVNASAIEFELPFTPSNSYMANGLIFNANQQILALLKLDTTSSIIRLNGTLTLSVSVTDSTVTITPSGTLWGITDILLDWNYA